MAVTTDWAEPRRDGTDPRRARWWPWAVLALGLVLTLALCAWSREVRRAESRALFERRVEAFGQALTARIQSYVDTLPGLRVFGELKPSSSDAEFVQYVGAISLQQRFPGLALTFVAELVDAEQRPAYIEAVRSDRSLSAEGHPGFQIKPPGARPRSMVVRHSYPFDSETLGYDLYDPQQRYRAAVDAAVASGSHVATGPVLLARDRFKDQAATLTSVVIRAATYSGGLTPPTEAARRAAAKGVVGVSFSTLSIVKSVLPSELQADADLRIVDPRAQAEGANALLFDSRWLVAAGAPTPAAVGEPVRFTARVADREWQVSVTQRAPARAVDGTTGLLFLLGTALSFGLAAMTRALVHANRHAEQRVLEGLTALQVERDNLAHSEARYRMLFANGQRLTAILDATPDFVGLADPQGRNIFLNLAGRCMLGRGEHEDVSALTIAECHPAWAAHLVQEKGIPAAMRDGAWTGRTAILAADGHEIPVSQVILCHRDAQGEITHLSTIARDLSELEQAQAQRQSLERRMLEAQKLESIGTLAGGVAHDFNNVLAAILGNVAIARQQLGPDDGVQPSLLLIQQAAKRARTLVQQILTFSRRSAQERSVVSLGDAVAEALSLLRTTLPSSAQLTVQLPDAPLTVVADASQVQQVVLNLCTNAWQAFGDRDGHIAVRLEAMDLVPGNGLPKGLAPGPHARLRVADDGPGMDPATRARIFEPFFTTKPVGQGTGLGLSVVQGIVVASGGAITVESQPGVGTTFDVYLPLVDAVPVPEPALAAVPTGAVARPRHVLYVDDDEVVTLTLSALLRRAGHRVTSLGSAAEAIAAVSADAQPFDLVLTDNNMPGMSGLTLAQTLRRIAPALPVVVTSGYVTEELQAQARQAGARAVLAKEFSVERLDALLAEIFDTPTREPQ